MKSTKYILLLLLMAIAGAGVKAQTSNRLVIPDVTTMIGQVQLPISIENTDEVVAAQFDLTLPTGVTAEAVGTLSSRGDDHQVTVRHMGGQHFRVMLFSPQNRPLRGQSGVVMYIPIAIPASYTQGSEHQLAVASAVLSNANTDNVITGTNIGKVIISSLPDLTVKSIAADKAILTPGGNVVVSWQVENIGQQATGGGWSEQISLVSRDGSASKLIATTYYEGTLEAKAVAIRQAEIQLPALLGIDGQTRLQVKLQSNEDTGESASSIANNTGTSTTVYDVGKVLTVKLPTEAIEEGRTTTIRGQLTRSGNWTTKELFTLTKTKGDGRLTCPQVVEIAAGQSGAYFYLSLANNSQLDADSLFTIQAEGTGYAAAAATLKVLDDELPKLSVSATKSELTEGESFRLNISIDQPLSYPLTVNIASEQPKRFSCPATVVIAAGETSATAEVTAIDNSDLELKATVAFNVSATRFESAECLVILNDNDIPTITLSVTPTTVAESAGPTAMIATIKRTNNLDKKVTLKLSDNSNGSIYYSTKTIVMEKGVESVQFSLGVIDNAVVDGERQVDFTAAVYVSSCSCSAQGDSEGSVTIPITITDDDGPALKATTAYSSWLEGSVGNVLTISRNTTGGEALTVGLSSDNDAMLEYQHEVTIPANKQSVAVQVNVKGNDLTGDNAIAIFTAKATGYASATCWVGLTDQTLPDAVITALTADKTEVEAGDKLMVTAQIGNIGNSDLPAQTPILLNFSGDGSSVTLYTTQVLAKGQSLTVSKELQMPMIVGNYYFNATVNSGSAVKELIYANNSSERLNVKLVSNFKATAAVEKSVYSQGERVKISGRIISADPADKEVEVYIVNEGIRLKVSATTDNQGAYAVEWTPYAQQMGHFAVGACFPGEALSTEMTSFDIYGMRFSSLFSTCEIDLNDTYQGEFRLTNPGVLPLTAVQVQLAEPSADVSLVSVPTTIAAGQTAVVKYAIKGNQVTEGGDWVKVPVTITTNEGVGGTFNIHYFVYSLKGRLTASESSVRTTMVKGQSRDYPITLSNTGKGETGKITIDLGNVKWLSTATPVTMPSLKSGESATVILRFTPTDDLQLNNPVRCNLAINQENGNAIVIPLTVEPVSEAVGTLTVDVCDESTYYTEEAPHVAGATVSIQHPTSHAVILTGTTDSDGRFTCTLPEGIYYMTVTESKHTSYAHTVTVDPGTENVRKVNLSLTGITVDMRYEETEIEDVYEIVTTVKYETNIPVPVIETILPTSIPADELAEGESLLFNAVLTNKGLARAINTKYIIPESDDEFEITSLVSPVGMVLAPQQSMVVPVKVTRRTAAEARGMRKSSGSKTCYMSSYTYYESELCDDNIEHAIPHTIRYKVCVSSPNNNITNKTKVTDNTYTPSVVRDVTSPTWRPYTSPDNTAWTTNVNVGEIIDKIENFFCNPCVRQYAEALPKCKWQIDPEHPFKSMIKKIPIIGDLYGCADDMYNCGKNIMSDNFTMGQAYDCSSGLVGCALAACKAIGGTLVAAGTVGAATGVGAAPGAGAIATGAKMYATCKTLGEAKDYWDCVKELVPLCAVGQNARGPKASSVSSYGTPSYITQFQERLAIAEEQSETVDEWLVELLGNKKFFDSEVDELDMLIGRMGQLADGELAVYDDMYKYKPSNISDDEFRQYIIRYNNTVKKYALGEDVEGDYADLECLKNSLQKVADGLEAAKGLGYESTKAMVEDALTVLLQNMEEERNSICASITLKISQTMTMTRQAVRGTLTVNNGHEDTAMTEVKLNLVVRDEDGNMAGSNLMEIQPESLKGFTGELSLSSGWQLAPKAEGEATILFIPTKYAAPTVSKPYTFTGTISYIDPFSGLETTRELAPATLMVNPSPELDLTYFLQRDVYGDDPLTLDVVEPTVPAEFALLINNKGNGDANNVRMVTNQPEITENEKGLFANVSIVSSQLNGEEKVMALGQSSINNDFGTIAAHSQAYAQWWLTCNLMGHFTEYKVEANHVTSYGNENLSLLGDVTIHELIHSLDASKDGKKLRGFMVNDIEDANDQPDMLYLTNGEVMPVALATSTQGAKPSAATYSLTVTPAAAGWNYGNILDPAYGLSAIKSVVRQSDGREIPLQNFWQTDRTLLDGKDWIYENRLHFADEFASGEAQTYLLTFEPTPDLLLAVAAIEGVPAEGVLAEEPVNEVKVKFNKAVDPLTFTPDDLSLGVQGVKQDVSQIGISTTDNQEFTLNLATLNQQLGNGYYTLTVQTADVTDTEGFTGRNGKSIGWVMFRGGLVQLLTSAWPENSGTVKRKADDTAGARSLAPAAEDNTAKYGSTVTLVAEAAPGYDFYNWTQNGEVVSTNQEYTVTAMGDMNVVANFTKKRYKVDVASTDDSQGSIAGMASGFYEYGSAITVAAEATEDYRFKHWIVDGTVLASTSPTLTLTVDKPIDIKATFEQEYFRQTITLSKGWNWVSSYLIEPLDVSGLGSYVYRVIGQTDELINDPEYGLVGNISYLESGRSYKVEALGRNSNSFRGHLADSTIVSLSLKQGWNWVAYPAKDQALFATVVTNADEGDYIVSQSGFAEYANGVWDGSVDTFVPGEGYLYKSARTKDLKLDISSVDGSRALDGRTATVTEQDVDMHRYPNTMNMTVLIVRDGVPAQAHDYNVYAVAGGEIRGISQQVGPMLYLTVYGEKPVDVEFVVESLSTGESFKASEVLRFNDDVVGSRKAPFTLSIGNATGIEAIASGSSPMTVYTPQGILVGREATMKMLRRLPKGIYIVNGQKTFVK